MVTPSYGIPSSLTSPDHINSSVLLTFSGGGCGVPALDGGLPQGGSSSSKYPYTGFASPSSPSSHASPSVFSSLGSEVFQPSTS